jgi:hypothetical protein
MAVTQSRRNLLLGAGAIALVGAGAVSASFLQMGSRAGYDETVAFDGRYLVRGDRIRLQ